MTQVGSVGDFLGREYKIEYEEVKFWIFKWHRIKKIIQLPLLVPQVIALMDEAVADGKRQEKEMKKSSRKGRRKR